MGSFGTAPTIPGTSGDDRYGVYEDDCRKGRDRSMALLGLFSAGSLKPWIDVQYKNCLAQAMPGERPKNLPPYKPHRCKQIETLIGLDSGGLPGGWSTLPLATRQGMALECMADCETIPFENYGDRGAIGCSNTVLRKIDAVLAPLRVQAAASTSAASQPGRAAASTSGVSTSSPSRVAVGVGLALAVAAIVAAASR